MEVLVHEGTELDFLNGGSIVSLFAEYDSIAFVDEFAICKNAEDVEVASKYFFMLVAEQSQRVVPFSHGFPYSRKLREDLYAMCVAWRDYKKTKPNAGAETTETAIEHASQQEATIQEEVEQEVIIPDGQSDISMGISEGNSSAPTSPSELQAVQ
jgi:hypothetical protein